MDLAVYNFGNTSAMRLIFVLKCSKFDADFKNAENNSHNVFRFGNNLISIGCAKHSVLMRKTTCHWKSIC